MPRWQKIQTNFNTQTASSIVDVKQSATSQQMDIEQAVQTSINPQKDLFTDVKILNSYIKNHDCLGYNSIIDTVDPDIEVLQVFLRKKTVSSQTNTMTLNQLATIVTQGFASVNQQITTINQQITTINQRLTKLEQDNVMIKEHLGLK